MVFNSLANGTTGLMCVGTIREFAVLGELKNLTEVACQLLSFYIECTETLYTWGIDEITSNGQLQHLAECCSVHTRVVRIGYVGCAKVYVG